MKLSAFVDQDFRYPIALKKKLLSKALLQKWAPFSLKERCEIVHRVWGLSISSTTL